MNLKQDKILFLTVSSKDSNSRLNWKSIKTFFECSAGPKNFVVANRRTSLLEHLSCLFLLMALCLFIAFVAWFVIVFLKRQEHPVPSVDGVAGEPDLLETIFRFETEHDYAKLPPFPVINKEENNIVQQFVASHG